MEQCRPTSLAAFILRTSDVDTRVTRRRLRSADTTYHMLVVPSTRRSTLSGWNNLPSSVRNASSLRTSRPEDCTFFRSSFDDDYAVVIVGLLQITFVCPRLLTVGASVSCLFNFVRSCAPEMSLT